MQTTKIIGDLDYKAVALKNIVSEMNKMGFSEEEIDKLFKEAGLERSQ